MPVLMDLLNRVVALALDSAAPKRLDIADPRNARFLTGNGEIATVALPAPPRDHAAGTLDDLINLALRFATEGKSPVVWYDDAKVVLVIDDDGHRVERATLNLVTSDVFRTVEGLAATKPWLEQKPFVRLLRIDLAGAIPPVELLDRIRRVQFDNGQTVTGEVRRDRESLGRSITSKVAADNGAEIPEEVVLEVPVYSTPGERAKVPIRCAIEVDAMRGAFQLVPMPDEVESARQFAVASIAVRLGDGLNDGIPAYQGQP